MERKVYMVDFDAYRPPEELNLSLDYNNQISAAARVFDQEALTFMSRVLLRSGISQQAFVPRAAIKFAESPPLNDAYEITVRDSKEEAELCMFGAVRGLLDKTGVDPKDIDIVVTSCSVWNTMPSLASMVMNEFGMAPSTDAYHLGGMGCAAGITATGMAGKLLKARKKNSHALVVIHENCSTSLYLGNNRSFLIGNVLFRMGAVAILLSNFSSTKPKPKYVMEHIVRSITSSDDDSYQCMSITTDADNHIGLYLPPLQTLSEVTGRTTNVTLRRIAPLILPMSEKLKYGANWINRNVFKKQVPEYKPNFLKACKHVLVHSGGRGVIIAMGKALNLTYEQQESAINGLYWYGNTSGSSVFYSLGHLETVHGVKKGEKIMQIGLGAGFECNSVVWRALRNNHTTHNAWKHVLGDARGEALDVFMKILNNEQPFEITVPIISKRDGAVYADEEVNGIAIPNGNGNGHHHENGLERGSSASSWSVKDASQDGSGRGSPELKTRSKYWPYGHPPNGILSLPPESAQAAI